MSETSPDASSDESRVLDERARLDARSESLSRARLIAFLVGIGSLALSMVWSGIGWLAIPCAAAFPPLIVLHHRVDRRRERLSDAATVASEEAQRRAGTPTGKSAPETGHAESSHDPESYPLDPLAAADIGLLEGSASAFRLLDATSTPFGAHHLRSLLIHPLLSAERVQRRQAAVKELVADHEGRRTLLTSLIPLRSRPLDKLARGLREEFEFARRCGLERAAAVLGTLMPLTILMVPFRIEALLVLLVQVVLHIGIVTGNSGRSNPARDRLEWLGPVCRALATVTDELERVDPKTDEWRETRDRLVRCRPTVERLSRRIRRLEWHHFGVLFEVINIVTLWELRVLPGAERLVLEHRSELDEALEALGHVEALLSIAALAAERDDFTWPTVVEAEQPFVRAESIGHPSIARESRIENPLEIGRDPDGSAVATTRVVTGSNMAGKSTYLRTVGVNLILAQVGAPICGRGLRMTPVQLHTDVNTRDSLDDGKSYFQVEVERVREAVAAADESPFVLAIFDELFRGTNAHERTAISRSLVEHLTDRGVLLLLATHDDRLAERVENADDPRMDNIHFRERVDEGELRFDYTLRSGPATTRNAIRVLEVSDYPTSIVERARKLADGES